MAPERVHDADAQLDALGRQRDRRCHGEHAATVAALGQPDLAQPEPLRLDCQRDRIADRHFVREREPQPEVHSLASTCRAHATRSGSSSMLNAGSAIELAPIRRAISRTWPGSASEMIRSSSAALGTRSAAARAPPPTSSSPRRATSEPESPQRDCSSGRLLSTEYAAMLRPRSRLLPPWSTSGAQTSSGWPTL